MLDKVLLFGFRKSHIGFFSKLKKYDKENIMHIRSSRDILFPRLDGLKDLNRVDFSLAIDFAVNEFYAKTEIMIPRFLLSGFFTLMAYYNYFRYYNIINNGYTKVLIWNGGKFRQRIAIDIAKNIFNIKVFFYENGTLPNRITFDSKGINYDNSVPREKSFFELYNNDLELPKAIVQRKAKREEKFNIQKTTLPKNYIFVPFQVDYDTQIITNSKWIKNMRELFGLIESISKKVDYDFILKEHPSSGKNYYDLHKRASNIKNISFENGYLTQELIEKSMAVITINSTVGIESLLFHKKVITLGDAFYQIENITLRAKNTTELLNIINDLDKYYIDFNLVDKFLKYLNNEYLVSKDENIIYNEFIKRLTK